MDILSCVNARFPIGHRRAMTFPLPWHIIIGHVDAKEILVRSVPFTQVRAWLLHNAVEQRLNDLSCFSLQKLKDSLDVFSVEISKLAKLVVESVEPMLMRACEPMFYRRRCFKSRSFRA